MQVIINQGFLYPFVYKVKTARHIRMVNKNGRQFKRIMACMNLLSEQAQFYKQILVDFFSK
jgi:hypothetical protein